MNFSFESNLLISLVQTDFAPILGDDLPPDINWAEFVDLVKLHRLIPLAYNALKSCLPLEADEIFQKEVKINNNRVTNNLRLLQDLVRAARKEKIRFVLVKGFSVSSSLYDNHYMRQANDVDILVEEDDMVRMDYLIRQLGFVQPSNAYDWDKRNFELLNYPIMRLRHTNHFFEYYKFLDGDQEIKVELHKRLFYVPDQNILKFIWATQTKEINGVSVNVFDDNHTLLFLIINAYQNSETLFALQGKSILRDYVDLYMYIKKFNSRINWGIMRTLGISYGLEDIMKTVVTNLYSLYPISFVEHILVYLECSKQAVVQEWPIDMTFIEKMLLPKERKEKIQHFQKDRVFLSNRKSIKISRLSCQQIALDLGDFIPLENRYANDIRYSIKYSRQNICLYVYLPLVMLHDYEKFLYEFIIYNNSRTNGVLYTIVDVYDEGNQMISKAINTPILRDSNVLRKSHKGTYLDYDEVVLSNGGVIIYTTLPYSFIGITFEEAKNGLACSFNVFKYMCKDTYHHIELLPNRLYDAIPLEMSN